MNTTNSTKVTCRVFWDTSDPNNCGWAYRYTDTAGTEHSGEIDGAFDEPELHMAQRAKDLSDSIDEVLVYNSRDEQISLRYRSDDDYRWV
jgi:hypothetical protein